MLIIPPELEEGKHYIYTVVTQDDKRICLLMGEMILTKHGRPRPTPEHRLAYKNGNVHDNRRNNLEWRLPGSENLN
jgi:hypothetical protein